MIYIPYRQRLFKVTTVIVFMMVLIFQAGCVTEGRDVPTIKKGVIDISDWDFTKNPELSLQGESRFYWKQWPLDAHHNYNSSLLERFETISWYAGFWTQKIDQSRGYGTLRLQIKRTDLTDNLMLIIPRSLAAVEVWGNGKKIVTHGKISKTAANEEIDGRPLRFELPQASNLEIMFLLSNHKHRLGGGFVLRNMIAEKTYFTDKNRAKPLIEGVITFLILIFGAYQILHFFSFSKYPYFLYFGLFCLLGVSRQLFVGEALIYNFIPDISFEIVQKMRYIGYYGGLGTVVLYHYYIFPGYYSKKTAYAWLLIALIGILYVIVTPVFYATYSAPFFQLFGVFTVLIGFYQMINALRDKKPYAKGMFISMSIVSIMLINDLLNAVMVIQTGYIITYGFLFYIGFQIILNNRIQKQSEKQLLKLSTDIEELSGQIVKKEEEISELRTETFQQLKSKEKLVENLRKIASDDTSVSLQNLIVELRSELLEDSQLTLIKNDIETLNHEFTRRMKEVHPNLTETDLEICSYLRMSLGRKEIARLRFTSVDAVKKSRSRLRKKMGLTEEVNLEAYIKTI